jgi:hypothetical protein
VVSSIALLLLCGCELFHRRTVVEESIRLEPGFSLTRRFTVDVPHRYELIVAFHRGTEIDIRTGPKPDEFGAEFVIRSGSEVVVEGTNDSNERRPALHRRDYTARYLAVFPARPGHEYELSFRITRGAPALAGTKPVVMISKKMYPPHEDHGAGI